MVARGMAVELLVASSVLLRAGVGHDLHREIPKPVAEELAEFLNWRAIEG